jgi:uncharacterized protein YjbJ (UPF0337 family)
MAQRVTAIFANRDDAECAADALVDRGTDRSHISMIARHDEGPDHPAAAMPHSEHVMEPAREVGDAGAPLTTTDETDVAKGAATGAVLGAVAGIAAGAAMLAVPGFGLILAAGPLSWAIGGAIGATVGGAVAGGVYGGLRDIGISEPHALAYEERIRGGGVLLTALVPNPAEADLLDVLAEYNAEDVTFIDDTSTSNPNIARGEAKHFEGEWRDRAADRTMNPLDDVAAKREKAAGKVQEQYGEEEEETVHQRL